MHTTQKPIGFWSAVSIGIGAMVGAGIFALLGEASAIAGSAVYISFIIRGLIALAQAALPVFGELGFAVVTVTALIATASAINANLYAVTNVIYQLAKDGELPQAFGVPIAHSREGLVISGVLAVLLSLLFDLSEIAAIGSISVLFVHAVTHIGHIKVIRHTGASLWLVILASISCLAAMILALIYVIEHSSHVGLVLVGFLVLAAVTELLPQHYHRREVLPRIE